MNIIIILKDSHSPNFSYHFSIRAGEALACAYLQMDLAKIVEAACSADKQLIVPD